MVMVDVREFIRKNGDKIKEYFVFGIKSHSSHHDKNQTQYFRRIGWWKGDVWWE